MNAKSAALIVSAALALVTSAAHGATQRTFVASNGLDGNPCSINLPCRSFGTAIGQTLAGGEVIVQDSAGYGIVTVTKSVSIIAPTGVYAGISVSSGQTGVTVNGAGIVVVLRGLSINGVAAGSVNGIHLVQASRLRIESCIVAGLASTGILHDAVGSEMIILDTIVRDNAGAGVGVSGGATVLIDRVRVEHNSGDGVYVGGGASTATATIRNSVMSHNGFSGVAAFIPSDPATTNVVVEDSVLSQNAGDGVFAGGVVDGGVLVTLRRNAIAGNVLCGVSAFSGGGGGYADVHATENTFLNNLQCHTKADGFIARVHLSRNVFFYTGVFATWTVNGGQQFTWKDNTGYSHDSVSATIPLTPF